MRRLARGLLNLSWPPLCPVCGLDSERHASCCSSCAAAQPRLAGGCRRCALELPRWTERCGSCLSRPPAFDTARAGFAYRAPIATLVQRFKFNRDLAAGRALARMLAAELVRQQTTRPDLLVPVPLHWRRRWKRGFNQAELLCRDLSSAFGALPWMSLLRRKRATSTQSELPAGRRRGNVRGAFDVCREFPGGTHVALVDDVMTTGATLNECARLLRRAGAG
ncbi:MAG: ComF family protein, partial [Wenzhouxiangellaceae bacterium]